MTCTQTNNNYIPINHQLLLSDNDLSPSLGTQFQLCDAQLQVLERSKEIASLQSRLTELVIQSPEAAVALQDLKEVIESVQLKRCVTASMRHIK